MDPRRLVHHRRPPGLLRALLCTSLIAGALLGAPLVVRGAVATRLPALPRTLPAPCDPQEPGFARPSGSLRNVPFLLAHARDHESASVRRAIYLEVESLAEARLAHDPDDLEALAGELDLPAGQLDRLREDVDQGGDDLDSLAHSLSS